MDAQAAAAEVEVSEAERGELAFSEAHQEESLSATRRAVRAERRRSASTSSAEKSSRSTSRSRGERIGTTGLPWSLNSAWAHLKNDIRTARTFLRVRGAASPQRSSMNSRRRVVPLGGSKSRELEVGVVDR